MVVAAISLGGNVGDRQAHLDHGVARLRGLLLDLKVSRYIETEPVGVGPQPPFLNAAVVGRTELEPAALLANLQAIERERARDRPFPGAPRTLDLDLILYGSLILSQPGLDVPHPRFRERLFVLEPLAEIAPALLDPGTGLTVGQLLHAARGGRAGARTP